MKNLTFKSYALIAGIVLAILPLQAQRVNLEKAEKVAQSYVESKRGMRGKPAKVRLGHTVTRKHEHRDGATRKQQQRQTTPPQDSLFYYIFNIDEGEGGFVIVSAEEKVRPVLGYSSNGRFDEDNLPPNFVAWMNDLQKQIAYAQTNDLPQNAETQAEWEAYLSDEGNALGNGEISFSDAVAPLIQTTWNQGNPYNTLCPSNMPTGCVATAMAQVMKYYNHPASGSGSSVAYTIPSGTVPAVSLEVEYDWVNMLNSYSGSPTPQQINAVATLMYHCGVSMRMWYTPGASSAYVSSMRESMIKHFGYDENIKYAYRSSYTDTEWAIMLKAQINAGMPVPYSACPTGEAHMFICDGYDNDDKFHFNWGWGGTYDGYYAMSALRPGPYDFTERGNAVLIDVKPVQGLLKELNVSEGTLLPTFRPFVFNYKVLVDASVETIDIAGITDAIGATVIGNVNNLPLKMNDLTDVTLTVDLENGEKQTYRISVLRGNLSPVSYTWNIGSDGVQISNYIGVAPGETLYVDWGDGTEPTTITRNATYIPYSNYRIEGNDISHLYSTAGTYQVTFYGENELDCPLLTLHTNQNNLSNVQVSQINVRAADHLRALTVVRGEITHLDVSRNINLLHLFCGNQKITELDLSNNAKLINLSCYTNQLSELDVSNNPALTTLSCYSNQLTKLDVSKNTALTGLSCYTNQLTELDVSNNTALTTLSCYTNQLTELDVSKNTALTSLSCYNNQLTELDVSNNTALTSLYCYINQLSELDVSNNTALTILSCYRNQLTELDVSNNTALATLSCYTNQLTELDVSNNTALTTFYCYENQLTELDVSNNTALTTLDCADNQLTELDVSNNTALRILYCENNRLTELDVSNNTALTTLYCTNNAIPLINLYTLAQQVGSITTKQLGTQNLPDVRVLLNTPVAIDTVFYGVNTVFSVNYTSTTYTLNNGEITFLAPYAYTYTVTISNPALLNGSVRQRFIASYIVLNKNNATIHVDAAEQLTATLAPSISSQSITWSSSNPDIATVTQDGLVTGVSVGTATITATTAPGGYTATCTVTITQPVTGITLNKDNTTLQVGNKETLTATIAPTNATNQTVTWSSDNPNVATVVNGTVTSISAGTAIITVTTVDGGFTATCTVTVTQPVTGITLNKGNTTLSVGSNEVLTATILPNNATNKTVTWSSDDQNVATVANGTVTGISAGTAIITVTTDDGGFTATCTVTVTQPVTGITLNKDNTTLSVGSNETLTVTIAPANATNKTVTWSSDNPNVATVVNGTVTGISAGTTIITATTDDGGFTATCTITVTQPVTGIALNKENTTLSVGSNETLIATILPNNATNKTVTWSSDDQNVATVANGTVTGISAGTAIITVTTVDGGFTATCTVTVTQPVTGITLNKDNTTLPAGSNETLTATILPNNATNKTVTWSSDNPNVATVVNGTVTGVSAGTAIITATTDDGGFTATCTVTVTPLTIPVTGITLNKDNTTLPAGSNETLTATILPNNATNKTVTWSSDNPNVATVVNGTVTGVSAGTAIITATTDDGGFMATCTVTVTPLTIPVTGITLNKDNTTLSVCSNETLTATLTPVNATNQAVTWSSDSPEIATVVNGTVTGVSVGTTIITATTVDGGFTASCTVTVAMLLQSGTGILEGTVSDVTTLEDNVTVHLYIQNPCLSSTDLGDYTLVASVKADTDGKFRFENLPEGVYIVQVEITGFESIPSKAIDLAVGATIGNVDFTIDFDTNTVAPSVFTGVKELSAPNMKVYPNPTDGIVTLVFEAEGVYNLALADISGKVLLRETANGKTAMLNISNYPAGVYLLTIDNGKRQNTIRIVKN